MEYAHLHFAIPHGSAYSNTQYHHCLALHDDICLKIFTTSVQVRETLHSSHLLLSLSHFTLLHANLTIFHWPNIYLLLNTFCGCEISLHPLIESLLQSQFMVVFVSYKQPTTLFIRVCVCVLINVCCFTLKKSCH